MVSVVAPRPTRFRYPVKVSGPADEGSAQGWLGWRACGGSSGCYLGLVHISTVERRVKVKVKGKVKVKATAKVEGIMGNGRRAGGQARRRQDSLRRLGQKAYQILLTHGTAKKRRRGFSAGFAAYAVFEGVGSRFASVASRSTVMNRAIAVGRKRELGQDLCECG